jgi:hypothetical protein
MATNIFPKHVNALVTADKFITALEQLRKGGDAVLYKGKIEDVPLAAQIAAVTIDELGINDSLTVDWRLYGYTPLGITKYELTLGQTEEIIVADTKVKSRHIYNGWPTNWQKEHITEKKYHLGFNVAKERHRSHSGKGSFDIVTTQPMGILFMVSEEPWSVSHDAESIISLLEKDPDYEGKFTAPSRFGSSVLSEVAAGLKKSLEHGIFDTPEVGNKTYPVHEINPKNMHGLYELSPKGYSVLEGICVNHMHKSF